MARLTVISMAEIKEKKDEKEPELPPICKEFPILMDMRYEDGIDRQINILNQCFPKGSIPVVCPECGTKNNITIKSLEEHIKDRDPKQRSETFDDCKKCGRSLVFESPMGEKKEEHVPKSPRAHIDKLKTRTMTAPVKKIKRRWDSKTGKWVPKDNI